MVQIVLLARCQGANPVQLFQLYVSLRHLWESPKLKTARLTATGDLQRDLPPDGRPDTLHDRLTRRAHTLETIARRREWHNDPGFARELEQQILDEELLDLSRAILADEHELR